MIEAHDNEQEALGNHDRKSSRFVLPGKPLACIVRRNMDKAERRES
jgi:hypothetical protein